MEVFENVLLSLWLLIAAMFVADIIYFNVTGKEVPGWYQTVWDRLVVIGLVYGLIFLELKIWM